MFDRERIKALETLINTKLEALEAVVTARSVAQKEAVVKAEVATEKRFESVNEFRGQLNDVIGQFATKEAVNSGLREHRTIIDANISSMSTLDSRLANMEGKLFVYVSVGSFFATVLAGIFAWFGHSLH